MGGSSAEREVSLRSGKAVMEALERRGYPCRALDADRTLPELLGNPRPDVAFIALHGRGGEDGTVQGVLEYLGIPYTGSGVLASALAMDKERSKQLFESRGITTPPFVVVGRKDDVAPAMLPFGFPLVVKPVDEGSTIGVSVVHQTVELAPSLEAARRHSARVMLEQFVPGREITVSLMGSWAFPAVEIIPEGEIYDYQSKYESSITRYVVPAPMSIDQSDRLASIAREAVRTLGCRGAVRADFRIDADDKPWLLEVNTIPGLTDKSLLPMAAAAAGMPFDDLVEEMLKMGLEGR
jgi:D-alanine-D-alanine ligase